MVVLNGVAAPLLKVSVNEITFQVPQETTLGTADVSVTINGQSSRIAHVQVTKAAPGIFVDENNHAAASNQDGTLNTARRAKVGSVVVVFGNGLGLADNPVSNGTPASLKTLSPVKVKPTVTVGGQDAKILFAGLAPGLLSVDQIHFIIPSLATGDYPVVITQDGKSSNGPVISVEQ